MISTVAVEGYRSLRNVRLALGPLNVVTGANGSGKSNLYRSLRLLADAAQGNLIQSLAAQGGLQSSLWAGPEAFSRGMRGGDQEVQGTVRRNAVSLKLGFSGDDYGYAVDLGLPQPTTSAFAADPVIKVESQWTGELLGRSNLFAERRGPGVRVRSDSGEWVQVTTSLPPFDSMMASCSDPRLAPELIVLRERMREWRFYDHLRIDQDAPARRAQVGTYTPVLAPDGSDIAAAVQTIREIGDAEALDAAVSDAFPGAAVHVDEAGGLFSLEMQQRGLLRRLRSAELSDGTLRYLMLVAALLTPRPPPLMVLNEPETSLHPELLPALARLIREAAERTQIVVVSHAATLVEELDRDPDARRIVLVRELGETVVENGISPQWRWPSR